jgi:hypothetical protein
VPGAVFKTVVRRVPSQGGSIPLRLRHMPSDLRFCLGILLPEIAAATFACLVCRTVQPVTNANLVNRDQAMISPPPRRRRAGNAHMRTAEPIARSVHPCLVLSLALVAVTESRPLAGR